MPLLTINRPATFIGFSFNFSLEISPVNFDGAAPISINSGALQCQAGVAVFVTKSMEIAVGHISHFPTDWLE